MSLVMLCSIFGILPISVSAQEAELAEIGLESTGNATLDAFINDYRFTDGASWVWNKGPMLASYGSSGCCAYCADYVKYCYGINNPRSGSAFYSVSEICAGDVLTVGNQSDGTGHWFVCLKRSGNSLYVAEGNYSNRVRIGWNYTISGNKFAEDSRSFTAGYHYLDYNPDPPTPQGHVMSESEGAGQTIPDGDYWICSKMAEDYFIDIPGNDFDTQNEKNVQTWKWDSGLPPIYDVFHLSYLNNGFYKITQINTRMVIDLYGAKLERGSNVSMWEDTGSNAQQWSIERTDSGYKIRSRCNNFYLDIENASYSNGTNVVTWERNSDNNQYFSFIPYSPNERPVENGLYKIATAVNNTSYVDAVGGYNDFTNKTNIAIWHNPDDIFYIEYFGNGYYQIYESTSGLAMEVNNDGEQSYLTNGRNVMLYGVNKKKNQLWKIKASDDSSFYFINQMSGYYLDLEKAKTEDGTNISQYQYNGNKNQKWNLLRVLQDDMITVGNVSLNSIGDIVDPIISVSVDDKELTLNDDYTVRVTADLENRKGTVTITGINNYCNSIKKEFSIVLRQILGDANGDGEVDSVDATVVQRAATRIQVPYSEEQLMCADIDGDGSLTIVDATFIQRYDSRIAVPYPVGEAK